MRLQKKAVRRRVCFSQIYTALKRGLDYGILKKDHGYYSLNMDPDMLYKAHTATPMEQGRRRRRRRRGRGRRGRAKSRRGRGRGRRRRRRRGRRRGRKGSSRSDSGRRRRVKSLPQSRSLTNKCRCISRKRSADVLRNTPVESLRKDTTCSYKKSTEQTPFRQSRDRSQSRSPSISSDKDIVTDRD